MTTKAVEITRVRVIQIRILLNKLVSEATIHRNSSSCSASTTDSKASV